MGANRVMAHLRGARQLRSRGESGVYPPGLSWRLHAAVAEAPWVEPPGVSARLLEQEPPANRRAAVCPALGPEGRARSRCSPGLRVPVVLGVECDAYDGAGGCAGWAVRG